jgi:hypothetical protein
MRRTTRTLFMAGVLVLTLGVAAPAQAGKADPVPIKGTLSGTETIYPAGTWDFEGYLGTLKTEFDIDGDGVTDYTCSEPAHELVVGTLTGNVSHLGKVTRELSYCAVWDGEFQYRIIDFTQVLITANGDTLNLEESLAFSSDGDDPVDFTAEAPIVGGTGRFVGASGTLYETGRVHASWWPPGFLYTTEGNEPWVKELSLTYTHDSYISYDASNRVPK